MPTDYKSLGITPEKKSLPGFIWFLIGLAIGLFIAFLVHLDKQPPNPVSFNEAVQTELDKLKKNSEEGSAEPEAVSDKDQRPEKEPKFNFYTILPEMEVFIPDSELKTDESREETPDFEQQGEQKSFVLQAGSFKNDQDADRLKAKLALLGFEATVKTVNVNGQQWHRVRMGPYNTTKSLYQSLSLLKQNEIVAMPLEIKSDGD